MLCMHKEKMMASMMHLANPDLGPDFTSFKLYDNPHYNDNPQQNQNLICDPFTTHHKPPHYSLAMENKGTQNEIECLKAELEYERKMRRKVESLNQVMLMELAEERKAREEAEQRYKLLEGEVEEERRMLRIAELWREERVQVKLSEAKLLMEEKMREITELIYLEEAVRKAEEVGPTEQGGHEEGRISQQKKEAENPHIKRGIKGFVEFPKAIRVQAKEPRIDLEFSLECQRAQLRVLLRNKGSNALGLMGNAQNLVM
ncbi:Protein BRANCHLESS TRICHOME [Rhynchospora pubera]|uniref:Protein BRANCHLESS TRICHOME n=1 Tax=Rhynchospora pubera TaxID=906938 RepID=A0AAV8EHE7_9POAL|nr:Protein BRANCHLESS TRICHOME [Rhynchospora pubera]